MRTGRVRIGLRSAGRAGHSSQSVQCCASCPPQFASSWRPLDFNFRAQFTQARSGLIANLRYPSFHFRDHRLSRRPGSFLSPFHNGALRALRGVKGPLMLLRHKSDIGKWVENASCTRRPNMEPPRMNDEELMALAKQAGRSVRRTSLCPASLHTVGSLRQPSAKRSPELQTSPCWPR